MYEFIDTTSHEVEGSAKASEAFTIDGSYLEDLVPGYRTLYVSGRETLSPEIETFDGTTSDGTKIKNKRYPGRVITVGYQLIAETVSDFRTSYNKLMQAINKDEIELVFDDERTVYYIGTVQEFGDVEPGRNAVTSEIMFICSDPYKYSVAEKTYQTNAPGVELVNPKFILSDNNGTVKAIPKIKAVAGKDCNFFDFYVQDSTGAYRHLIVGDTIPETYEKRYLQVKEAMTNGYWYEDEVLKKVGFNDYTDISSGWTGNTGYGKVLDPEIYENIFYTTAKCKIGGMVTASEGLYVLSYPDDPSEITPSSPDQYANSWTGPTLSCIIPNDHGDASSETTDWTLHADVDFYVDDWEGNDQLAQAGFLQIAVISNSNEILAAVTIKKKPNERMAKIYATGDNPVDPEDWFLQSIECSENSKHFGNHKDALHNIDISVKNEHLTFDIAGFTGGFITGGLSDVAERIIIYMGRYDDFPAMMSMNVKGFSFKSNSVKKIVPTGTQYKSLYDLMTFPTVFDEDDEILLDCNDASIKLAKAGAIMPGDSWTPRSDIGDIQNDWETFTVPTGQHVLKANYEHDESSWQVTFREKYL